MPEQMLLERNEDKICLAGGDHGVLENRIDVKMLLNNQIPGFLPLCIQFVDERSVYTYSIKGTVSLEKLLQEEKADFGLVRGIYQAIYKTWRRGQEFFLQESHFILKPSFLFWNVRKSQLMICYFPGYEALLEEQLTTLSQFLLQRIDHQDKQCVTFAYGIYEIIEREGFVSTEIAAYLRDSEKDEDIFKMGVCSDSESKKETGWDDIDQRDKKQIEKEPVEKKRTVGRQERGIFGLKNVSRWRGLPEWIEICQDALTVGRDAENDFVIPAAWISGHHARIDKKQSQYYLTDLGSTNGVYLNGKKIISNHPVLCHEKDMIAFADITYCFQRAMSAG